MKLMDKIDKIFVYVGMASLFLIMSIIAVDGLGRNLFDMPVRGAYALIESYLMVFMIFPLVGYTWDKKGHINVTLFISKMPKSVQNVSYLLTLVMGFLFFAIITYTGFNTTYSAFVTNKMTTGLIRWPLWIAYLPMPVGGFSFCARMVLELISSVSKVRLHGIGGMLINDSTTSH